MMTKETIPKDEITLKELIEKIGAWYNFLLSKWKTIVIAGAIGGLLGIGYSLSQKPVYTAALTFALEDDKSA
ncbi:MAG: exopolysaccharide biosynthesis protein, partial [Leadbetterella sp.]|nr:exopolysaccharide biosynthesis protein [Leadbetterella sp.]